jgi:hypothetical protein
MKKLFFSCFVLLSFFSCKKDNTTNPNVTTTSKMNFQFQFDATQTRLNNLGNPAVLPAGNAAQTPVFHQMSVHYIELAKDKFTLLGKGAIVYKGAETTKGGENAVDFDKAAVADQNVVFATINLKDVAPGTYEWVRASVTYQNYDIKYNLNGLQIIGDLKDQLGTVSSFVGFNTYMTKLKPKTKELLVNDDKKQGFWAFETLLTAPYDIYNKVFSGEAPAGSTTVVNPLAATSPIPAGSCVVTGKFATPLVVTGKETKDVNVTLSFSVNKSLEWEDTNKNGQLDWYADPSKGTTERIVDMGLRGLIPSYK